MNAGADRYLETAVLILTFNHERYIRACIESVQQAGLNDFHVWILDDGSTDGTLSVIEECVDEFRNITLLTQPNSGGRSSRCSQRLIDESHSEFIILMSGDDLFGPGSGLRHGVEALKAEPQLAASIPRMVYLSQDPALPSPESHGCDVLEPLRSGIPEAMIEHHLYRSVSRVFLQGMIVRRRVVEAFGGFDQSVLADDYAFVMRMFQHMADAELIFRFDETCLWLYRVHAHNAHRDPVRQFSLILEVVGKYIPEEKLAGFRWDAVVFSSHAQLVEAQQAAAALLGRKQAVRAALPSVRSTLQRAVRRGDLRLICKVLFAKSSTAAHRWLAFRQLFRALAAILVRMLASTGGTSWR